MTDVPETTFEKIKLYGKRAARITSAELGDIVQCAEREQLKQQYDSTRDEWRKLSQPPIVPFKEGEASERRFSAKRRSVNRNAAANRMYLHRATCALCRRRR